MAIDAAGNLASIDMDAHRTLPPEATSLVRMVGNMVAGNQTINDVRIYDVSGAVHTLTITLTDNAPATPGQFTVGVTDETGTNVGGGTIRFGTDGTPLAGSAAVTLNLNYQGQAQAVTLNFGTPGAYNGATRLPGASSIGARVDDGHPLLGVTELSFDDNGVMQIVYSATERREGPRIALASFPNESALELSGGRLISGTNEQQRTLGRPGEGVFGRIAGGSLEMANVDLTTEFADMIIIQRGYQASSRVMTVSNEMLEQLYNSTRGG
jgi:flagellar hook protein FlgE